MLRSLVGSEMCIRDRSYCGWKLGEKKSVLFFLRHPVILGTCENIKVGRANKVDILISRFLLPMILERMRVSVHGCVGWFMMRSHSAQTGATGSKKVPIRELTTVYRCSWMLRALTVGLEMLPQRQRLPNWSSYYGLSPNIYQTFF